MSGHRETPKPSQKKLKQVQPAGPMFVTGLPRPSAERAHKVIGDLAKQGEFQSFDELNAHLRKLMDSGELDRMINAAPESPEEQAQELAYSAMEEPSGAKARKLAEKALKLNPDCVDAMMVYAQTRRLSPEEYLAEVRAAVKTGERILGSGIFREERGHFWGLVETRPYMRARRELAMALIAGDRLHDAVSEFEEMLALNPNDHQGVRDYLLGVYLALSDLDGAASLFRQYKEDDSAVFAWGKVILHMLNGRRAEAREALLAAFRNNPWPAKIFFGGKPPEDPPAYGIGDEDEGQHAAVALLPAMAEHPDVLIWIAKESVGVMERLTEPPARRGPRRIH